MDPFAARRRASANGCLAPLSMVALLLLACTILVPSPARAAGREPSEEHGLFMPQKPLALRLEASWSELGRRSESGKSLQGRLIYASPTGEEIDLSVRFETRGVSRLEICDSPMLTLELEEEQIVGTLFEGQPMMHLTTQCKVKSTHLQYLVLEFLAYRLFALLTDYGLQARLLSVEYVDPAKKHRPKQAHAFLVEDIGLAAGRRGMEWRKPKSIDPWEIDTEARALFVLYQFLIGNTDWSLRIGPNGEPCCHNVAVVGRPGQVSGLLPIPFDLDHAGLVDAEYGAPDSRMGILSVRQRVWRGECDLNPHLEQAIDRLNGLRAEIRELFEASELLGPRSRDRSIKYLDSFYEIINDPKKRSAEILEGCR